MGRTQTRELKPRVGIGWLVTRDGLFHCSPAGDEVLEWNEQSLVDCTFEEVTETISSDDFPDLHLVVCRDK